MIETRIKRFLLAGTAASVAILILHFAGKEITLCLAPFVLAYLISLAVRPAASFISRRFGVGRRFVSVFIVTVLITSIFLIASWMLSVMFKEARDLADGLMESLSKEDNFLKRAYDFASKIADRIPFLSSDGVKGASLYDSLSSLLTDSLGAAAGFAASAATSVIGKLPGFIFAAITAIISTFYICTDKGAIAREAETIVGKKNAGTLRRTMERINRAASSYFKSYFLMTLITFAELLIGFVILGVDNALLLAFIIALVDLLPIVGSGIVLVPWAASELLFTGNAYLGTGLIVLIVAMYLIRQFLTPHVLGSMIGVHPLLSLAASYIGLVTFGFFGAILFPIALSFIKSIASDKAPE